MSRAQRLLKAGVDDLAILLSGWEWSREDLGDISEVVVAVVGLGNRLKGLLGEGERADQGWPFSE